MWKMLPFTEIVKMGVLKTRGMVGGECVEGVGNTGSTLDRLSMKIP